MHFLTGFLAGVALFFVSRFFPFSSIFIFLLSAFYLAKWKKALLILAIACGLFYAMYRVPPAEETRQPWARTLTVTGRFLPETGTSGAGSGLRTVIVDRAVDEDSGQEIEELEDEMLRIRTAEEFGPEDEYELLLRTEKDRTRFNPGGLSKPPVYGQLISIQGHEEAGVLRGDFFEKYRESLHDYIQGRFSRDSADFISAITIGGSRFDEGLKNAFNATGLAHILSISGTHFGLFSVVVFGFFAFVIKRMPYAALQRLTLYMSPSQAAAVFCLPLMTFYLGISGGSIPAVRSFVMIGLFLVGLLINRKGFWLNTLLLAAFLLLLWDPSVLLELSFQLSFIAVLFIGLAVGSREDREEPAERKNRIIEFLLTSLKLSLAAMAGTAPIVAYHFHYVSIISPLANLIVAPLIGFILIPLALVSSFAYLLTGFYVFAPLVSVAADISLGLVRLMAGVPFADAGVAAFPLVLVAFFYAGLLLFFTLGKRKALLVLPVLPLAVYFLFQSVSPKQMSITFVDVGQGDSAIVELPDRRTIVLDTGRTGYETAGVLKYLGRRDIDALVLTHSHPDHTGGLANILDRFHVKELWDNGRMEYPEELSLPSRRRSLERGDIIEHEKYSLAVLHPYPEFYTLEGNEFVEENNSSLVLRIRGREHSFLLAGDIEEEAEENLLHLANRLKSDVIKVPHHGGRTSAVQDFLHEVSPSIAVISAGRDNSFGHPSQDMLEALSGTAVLRTDLNGAIRITETGRGLEVKTWRENAFEKADSIDKEMRNLRRLFTSW